MALRMSLPIFVMPENPGKPALSWRAARGADGSLVVRLANSGTAHAQVTSLQVAGADGKPLAPTALSGYVLPGQVREWRVRAGAGAAATSLHLRGTSTTGAIDETLALDED
jgi:fimbrial chaperone protein